VGGLPTAVLAGERAAAIVATVERELWTPMGLRSLAPGEPGYAGRYEGPPHLRDAVYHQGTVWPWLLGPFVDAWLRVHCRGAGRRAEAEARFVAPLRAHLQQAGLGHVSEIADGDPPHAPRGCPWQAWSLGELIRMSAAVAAG
jgi:glycogen debranching enzyme